MSDPVFNLECSMLNSLMQQMHCFDVYCIPCSTQAKGAVERPLHYIVMQVQLAMQLTCSRWLFQKHALQQAVQCVSTPVLGHLPLTHSALCVKLRDARSMNDALLDSVQAS